VDVLQGNTKARCVQHKSFSTQCCVGQRKWFNYPLNRKRDYRGKYSTGYCKYSHQDKKIAHLIVSSEFPKRDNRK
jgi:hypothetical protein